MRDFLHNKDFKQFLTLIVIVGIFFAGGILTSQKNTNGHSVEVGIASLSPRGAEGGVVIPASGGSGSGQPGCYFDPFQGESGQYVCPPPSQPSLPTPPPPAFSGSSGAVNQGGCTNLTWSASSATSCDGLNFSTSGATSGSQSVCPTSDTSYSLICYYNPSTYSPSTLSSSVGVAVLHPGLSISANPTQVRSGNSSLITWSATDVDSCAVTGPGGFSQNTISGSASSGPLTQQSVFIFTCQNEGGNLSQSVTVSIIPAFEEI